MRREPDLELDDPTLLEPVDASDLRTDPQAEPSYDEIAAEAYARYLSRGGADGGDVADWLEAEQILREQRRLERGE